VQEYGQNGLKIKIDSYIGSGVFGKGQGGFCLYSLISLMAQQFQIQEAYTRPVTADQAGFLFWQKVKLSNLNVPCS
jgi:hypothetical protein